MAKRVTPRTRAIVAVHYGGQSADLDELRAIADDAGVVLLEDAAEAHGATYHGHPVGSIGHAGMFSFTPTKNMTTGEGGMVVTNDGDLGEHLRRLRNHGQASLYHHATLGYNWRMSEIQAAIGSVQLRKLPEVLTRKRAVAARLDAALQPLEGITAPAVREDRDHVYMLYSALVPEGRDAVLARMLAEGIEARLYFPPAHRQAVFAGLEPADLPVTDQLARQLLSLPVHSRLEPDEIDQIAASVRNALQAG